MTKAVVAHVAESINDLKSTDRDRQNYAYQALLDMTAERVDWAYEVWDDLLRLTAKGEPAALDRWPIAEQFSQE